MIPLVVNLTNTLTNAVIAFAFDSSPVRIGRNQLNELAINDAVVSQWHGLFRFDEQRTVYIDLGSTNGTLVEGRRIDRNTEVPLDQNTVLRVAHFELRVARFPVPPEALTRRTNSFLPSDPTRPLDECRTMMFSGVLPTAAPKADPRVVEQVVGHTAAVYDQYVRALGDMNRYLEHYIAQVPADARGVTLAAVAERMPHFARTREYRRLGAQVGLRPDELGEVDLEDWLKRLVYGSESAPAARGRIDVPRALERLGAVLETFAQSYVDLRSGHEQFISDIGLRLNIEPGGLGNARNARAALAYLLDWTSDHQTRVSELNRSFADLALHQVGLLNGVIDGVRGILAQLLPENVAGLPAQPRSRDVRTASGAAAGFMGGRVKQWWRVYAAKHAELEEGDRFTKDMFGRHFANAYFTIMGNSRA